LAIFRARYVANLMDQFGDIASKAETPAGVTYIKDLPLASHPIALPQPD
jgi:hypothetical protein